MKTYQDFLTAENREAFIIGIINDYVGDSKYQDAIKARLYARQANTEIFNRKFIYYTKDSKGRVSAQKAVFRANNQIANGIFGKIIRQKIEYTLGNGISIDEGIKKKLPKTLDRELQKAGRHASLDSVGWVYAYIDKGVFTVKAFKGTEIIPLYDEFTDDLLAAVRFWRKGQTDFVELYELQGVTVYKRTQNELKLYAPTTAYKTKSIVFEGGSRVVTDVSTWSRLPFSPFYNNDEGASDFTRGTKAQLDLYDIIMSDFGNNLQDNQDVYWVLTNYSGQDMAEFKEQLDYYKSIKVDGDGSATPHQLEVPFNARQVALDMLRKQIYSDQMALDVESIKGGSLTNVAIKAAQSDLDLKASEFEWGALDCVNGILALWREFTGYPDVIEADNFVRRTLVNDTEIVQNLAMSPYLSQQTIIESNPYAAGDELERIRAERKEDMSGVTKGEASNSTTFRAELESDDE
jgi:SPP1 family phage portal protein